jgi:hypothetical protein|tara:strand:+ start:2479 stop:4020 length:1542 start_codon:yes stop_codon:yes gene_type:complete
MADNLQIYRVSCEGGLNTNRDVLSQGEVAPGSAVRLINYEPSVTGGYRRINGFVEAYPNLPGTGAVLGVCVANNVNDGILACRKPTSGNNYLHYWNNTTGAWVTITTSGSPTMVGVSKIRFHRYNWSADEVILVDGVNPAATYNGTTYAQITHANAPTNPKYVTTFKSHMFLAGASASPNSLHFSAPLDENDFSVANGAGEINVGFDVVQIKTFRDELYIFGTNNIKKLVGNSVADFQLQQVTNDLGCIASDSVVELGGDLLFIAPDGLRPISGTDRIGDVNLETISKNVQSIFNDIVLNQDLNGLSSVIIRQKSQFRMFFSASESQGVIGALRQQQSGSIGFEFGQLLGITATCADSGYIGQSEFVIHGDSSGKVYRQERGTNFNGSEIFSLFQTPFYHMGDPELRKNFLKLSTYMRSEGNTDIILGIVYDYEDVNVLNPTNYDITTRGAAAFFNEATYDAQAIYDGNPSPVVKTSFAGSGTSISIKYVTNDTNASHSIQGFVLLFGLGDRR